MIKQNHQEIMLFCHHTFSEFHGLNNCTHRKAKLLKTTLYKSDFEESLKRSEYSRGCKWCCGWGGSNRPNNGPNNDGAPRDIVMLMQLASFTIDVILTTVCVKNDLKTLNGEHTKNNYYTIQIIEWCLILLSAISRIVCYFPYAFHSDIFVKVCSFNHCINFVIPRLENSCGLFAKGSHRSKLSRSRNSVAIKISDNSNRKVSVEDGTKHSSQNHWRMRTSISLITSSMNLN